MHKITGLEMIGYGDKTRTQQEVTRLFHETLPYLLPKSQGTLRKIAKQFREFGQVKLDVMLEFEENPHTLSRQAAITFNVSHTSIVNILKENKMYPYKTIPTQELMEDDFDRKTYFVNA